MGHKRKEGRVASIANRKTEGWTGEVLNEILRSLRKLDGMVVSRNRQAGTVVCKGSGSEEYLRGMLMPGGLWLVTYDSMLIVERKGGTNEDRD
jgi:hypothetical protein